MADTIDINAARRNIRSDEYSDVALTEGRKHALALVLRFVAVNSLGADASPTQVTRNLIGAALCPCEDQSSVNRFPPQHVDQDCRLRGAVDTNNALLYAFNRRGDRRYRDLDRVAQHARGKFCDGARHGRRKHQHLPLDRKLGDYLTDIVDKAHVEHPVGLVENEAFDLAQSKRIALDEIKQPAGRCDKNIDTVKQRANLSAHRYAADRQRGSQAQMTAVCANAIEDLA